MGSGLILVLIVAAWLAVLVPMALRSQEVRSSAAADRFQVAVRVLSRRRTSPSVPPDPPGHRRPATSRRLTDNDAARDDAAHAPGERPHFEARMTALVRSLVRRLGRALRPRRPVGPQVPVSAARRRHRTLGALVVALLLATAGALVGPSWLWIAQGVVVLLLVAMLLAIRAAGARQAPAAHLAAGAGRTHPGHRVPVVGAVGTAVGAAAGPGRNAARRRPAAGAGAPGRATAVRRPNGTGAAAARPITRRPLPLTEQQQADRAMARAAARAEQARLAFARERAAIERRIVPPSHVAGVPNRMPARTGPRDVFEVVAEAMGPQPPRGAKGEPWQPVPVPTPTYLSAAQAPRPRPARTVEQAERELGMLDHGPGLEEILRSRRASGDW